MNMWDQYDLPCAYICMKYDYIAELYLELSYQIKNYIFWNTDFLLVTLHSWYFLPVVSQVSAADKCHLDLVWDGKSQQNMPHRHDPPSGKILRDGTDILLVTLHSWYFLPVVSQVSATDKCHLDLVWDGKSQQNMPHRHDPPSGKILRDGASYAML